MLYLLFSKGANYYLIWNLILKGIISRDGLASASVIGLGMVFSHMAYNNGILFSKSVKNEFVLRIFQYYAILGT